MKKIRLGNDIQFNWTLLNNEGGPYNLEGADLRITYTTFRGVTEVTDFSVSGNVVSWTFKGKDQKILGDYIVTLQQNAGEDNMLTVDKCDAFRLVARSCDAGGEDTCSHLQVETVELQSEVDGVIVDPVIPEIGENGNWFVNGKDTGKPSKGEDGKAFTYDDFTPEQIEELQKPATDVADSLLQLEKAIESAEQSRVLAENNRNESELLREQSEQGRTQAETERSSAETKREENESKRLTAEQARIQAESARSVAEQDRVSNEQSRVSAEEDRVAEETKRSEAESQRTQAETKRAEAETSRVLAETKRSEAEASRVSAETARVSAEKARVTEFEQLKQESQTAIDNANKSASSANDAANKANEAAESVESRLSQVYANYDAIVSSGETDQNKIYIDAETNTSYRFNGTEFVSIGGGSKDNYEECEGICGTNTGNYINLSVNTDMINYINSLDVISLIFCCKTNVTDRTDWHRYIGIIFSQNSNKLSVCILHHNGKLRLFNNGYEGYLSGYKNILSFNRSNGKLIAYNEAGKYFEGTNENSIQPDWIKLSNQSKPYIQYQSGDAKNALLELVWLNFDVDRILQFNSTLLVYLRNFKKSGLLPANLIHKSYLPEIFEKYTVINYNNFWTTTEKDSEGYTVSSTDTANKTRYIGIGYDYDYTGKAFEITHTIEIIEGSIKVIGADNSMSYNSKLYDIVNKETGEHKALNEELTVGTWDIIVDVWFKTEYGPQISSIQVPAKIKCISQKYTPYAAIMQWKGDKLYNGNQIYDGVTKELRNVDTNISNATISIGSIPIDSPTYATKAPTSSNKPRFIGEKYYDTATGDIYEAGDFTAFKKLNS